MQNIQQQFESLVSAALKRLLAFAFAKITIANNGNCNANYMNCVFAKVQSLTVNGTETHLVRESVGSAN